MLLLLLACKDAPPLDSAVPGPWDFGDALAILGDGQPALFGSFDGGPSLYWALDTGADGLYLDEDLADGAPRLSGTLEIGPLTLAEVSVTALELDEAEAALGVDLGGLAGGPVFEGRFVTLDYAAGLVHFTDGPLPDRPRGAAAPVSMAYEVQARIPVLTLELGGPARLVADTGSGVTVITRSRFEAIDDGTLPQLDGYVWASLYGSDAATVTRLPPIEGLNVGGSWAVVVPDEHHLASLFRQAGIQAEGFIGYPFWRRAALGVDADAASFTFWPYDAPAPSEDDEWRRVGVELALREGSVVVEMVFSPSDAATQGIQVGDVLRSIDGVAPESLDAARLALRGEGTRTLALERDGAPLSRTVAVEDLLPAI